MHVEFPREARDTNDCREDHHQRQPPEFGPAHQDCAYNVRILYVDVQFVLDYIQRTCFSGG